VTRQHCDTSEGGLTFTTYDEFASALDRLFDQPDEARRMGESGKQYVLDHYRWPGIVEAYQEVIARVKASL
jgi:glycosyltransferase involved in cell wall biosynthesis